jgi:rapamycin-insensitive companion of mTOR
MRSLNTSRSATPRQELASSKLADYDEDEGVSKVRLAELKEMLNKEIKIKEGSENLLDALNTKKAKQAHDQILRVEDELNASNQRIVNLKSQIEQLQLPSDPKPSRLATLFRGQPLQSPPEVEGNPFASSLDVEFESPTFSLGELLQSLEMNGMKPDYYIDKANSLVELFKRHPALKYDLSWTDFGMRVQTMLLSDSKEVVAAGYRMTRYAITDRKSLQTIRSLNTDYLVVLSLIKESKASVEREQALKFVRAFLDVSEGVHEVSPSIVRTIVSIAEHAEDHLRGICIETLAEIMIRDTTLLVSSGGIGPLLVVLGEGGYEASESLITAFLYLLDTPERRRFIRPGYDLDIVFSSFTDSIPITGQEERLKGNARTISTMLKTWPGLLTLSMYDFRAIRSLIASLHFPQAATRDIILELIFDILRIKPPSWSSAFLAGRRLTTYGRVANLKSESSPSSSSHHDNELTQKSFIDHFATMMLAVLFESGMMKALLGVIEDNSEPSITRKATLLLGEVLKMAGRLLPASYSANLQLLPDLFSAASNFTDPSRYIATGAVYQIDSVNRTLYRTLSATGPATISYTVEDALRGTSRKGDQAKPKMSVNMDESQFRSQMLETQVLNTSNYQKWKWDVLLQVIEGPLLNPKRLDEAIKATKFTHRLVGFYRPFKFKFSNIKNTKPNQRYVRAGCALIKTLLQNPEGVKLLAESKFLRQLAECLAQLDRMSGLTSPNPLFSSSRLVDTLSGGYFEFLGTLSQDPKGIAMMERWHMINMFYHIIELKDRDDLITTLLVALEYSVDGHLRILLSRALTACSKRVRICATNVLYRYATLPAKASDSVQDFEWAIRLLITQLYDPEVEVCETAVKILEEACNGKECLEYVVKCRPALDHLGEIGAPLLLRFLSTSIGYYYLDELDYISQEMDDWFLGRNDTYVTLVEASLARAFDEDFLKLSESAEREQHAFVPPHFYRELARTKEGCRLLEEKGHFEEFSTTIRECGMESSDPELIVKVKGCMWAVGNVGSMELGAPFLEESDVVQSIVKLAQNSAVMTVKGTAFFVLGLISRSIHGLEILDECGWDATTTTMGMSLGFCIPLDLRRFFSVNISSTVLSYMMKKLIALK